MSKQNLIILFGGESRERLVSVATAQNISQALPQALCWFWALDDQIYEVSHEELLAHQDVFKTEFKPSVPALFKTILEALDSEQAAQNIFVLALHGDRGENGVLQSWLEERKIAFTGPNSKACALTMDKAASKKAVQAAGVRIADSCLLRGQDADSESQLLSMISRHPKLILKPNYEGSSFGLCLITKDNLELAREKLKAYPDRMYILEAFVEGTELTVGIYDEGSGARALTPTELRVQNGFADYDGKYLGLGTKEITPAEVPDNIVRAAQRMALSAHEILGCEGYSRTDMMVDDQGPVYLETNPLPGLTKASLVPQALAYEGVSIRDFLVHQVELARVRLSRSV